MDLDAFLEIAPRLNETARGERMAKACAYYRGRQYKGRAFDADGYYARAGALKPGKSPAWSQREIPAVYNVVGIVARRLTRWALAGDNWCRLEIPDDPEAEDFLSKTATSARLQDVVIEGRNFAGGEGTGVVSLAWADGLPRLEAHDPACCWPLAWVDEEGGKLAAIAEVYEVEDPFAGRSAKKLLECRYWDAELELVRRRYPDPNTESGFVWREIRRAEHKLGFCPVVWWRNNHVHGCIDGEPDVPDEGRGLADEINELLCAGGITTKRNAEDTLVVKEHPSLNPGDVKKGSFNAIFARGGAEYLTQNGESARICLEYGEKRADQLFHAVGVVMVSLDVLGKATTGEALKKIFFDQTVTTQGIRTWTATHAIVPLARMLLESARVLLGRGEQLAIAPRVETKDGITTVTQRTPGPGRGDHIEVVWPDPFPATTADKQQGVTTAVNGVTGNVMSLDTALATMRDAGIPILDVEAEKRAIEEQKAANAALQAKSLGMGEEPDADDPGKSAAE